MPAGASARRRAPGVTLPVGSAISRAMSAPSPEPHIFAALDTPEAERAARPAAAGAAGADDLVIGRPMTARAEPPAAARRIVAELDEARGAQP